MSEHLTIGERVAWYRRRRGMSQEVLAGLIGRTADWLHKVERGRIQLDRLSVIRSLAGALGVPLSDLLAEQHLTVANQGVNQKPVSELRATLTSHYDITTGSAVTGPPPSLHHLRTQLGAVWGGYQSSRYGLVASLLPGLMTACAQAADQHHGDAQRAALQVRALTYHAAAAVLTKVGDADLAWITAERGLAAAREGGEPVIEATLLRSVAHTVLATGRFEAAIRLVDAAAGGFRTALSHPTATRLSVFGTLLLTGAVAASRMGDRTTVRTFLEEASVTADKLGHDGNHMWTAFGPTNVAIHRIATSIELNDLQIALDLGPHIDTSGLPLERRVRHALELARAWNLANRREHAMAGLLDAERLAPEQVRAHFLSRQLVLHWMRTQRGRPTPGLVGLADRMQVLHGS